jgi:hypothetical protein
VLAIQCFHNIRKLDSRKDKANNHYGWEHSCYNRDRKHCLDKVAPSIVVVYKDHLIVAFHIHMVVRKVVHTEDTVVVRAAILVEHTVARLAVWVEHMVGWQAGNMLALAFVSFLAWLLVCFLVVVAAEVEVGIGIGNLV